MSYITTFTGRRFFYDAPPDPHVICLEDIAHALSNMCRFAGHVRTFYSVAEHSIHVSRHVAQTIVATYEKGIVLAALLHDATEAYLVDIPRPLKHDTDMFPYRVREKELARVIEQRFGLEHGLLEHRSIKNADDRMLATEGRDLIALPPGEGCGPSQPYDDLSVRFPLSPAQAERMFIDEVHLALANYREPGMVR